MIKGRFNKAAGWVLGNRASRVVFAHSDKFTSIPFLISDSFYLSKDMLASGTFASLDTLTGVFALAGAGAMKFVKKNPVWACRANGLFCYGAIGSMFLSGIGYEFGGGGSADPAKITAALGFLPGATLTFFQDEIARTAEFLNARSKNLFSRFLTSVSRYPLVWTGCLNMVGVSGLMVSGMQNLGQEWPMVLVAATAAIGNLSLMAADPRMAALHTKAVAAKNSLKPEMG